MKPFLQSSFFGLLIFFSIYCFAQMPERKCAVSFAEEVAANEDTEMRMAGSSDCRSYFYGTYGTFCEHNDCSMPSLPNPSCSLFQIPVVFTVVTNSSGFTSLNTDNIELKLAELNSYYAAANLKFVQCDEPRYINDDDFYNFHIIGTDPDDGIDDDNEIEDYDLQNVINIYLVNQLYISNFAYCGFSYLPTTYTSGAVLNKNNRCFISNNCFSLDDTTLEHEIGHFLGLLHTHRGAYLLSNTGGMPNEAADGSEACNFDEPISGLPIDDPNQPNNKGDGIADTPPDPGFIGNVNSNCQYTGSYTPHPSQPLDLNNMMSYSRDEYCDLDFTACQLRKMYDVLLNCRNYLCCSNAMVSFGNMEINHPQSPYQEICAGEAIPTLQAFANSCYNWYDSPFSTTPLLENAQYFTPPSSIVDVHTPATYEIWVEPANTFAIETPCRSKATITVFPDAGDGVSLPTNVICCGNFAVASPYTIGFWIDNQPITDASNLTTAFNNGLIFRAEDIDDTLASFNFLPNCETLAAGNYYITPFASFDDVAAPNFTIGPNASIAIPDNNNQVATVPIEVTQMSETAVLQQVCLYIDHDFTNDLSIQLTAPNGTDINLLSLFSLSGPGTDFGTASNPACFVNPGLGYNAGTCNGVSYPNSPCYIGNIDSETALDINVGNPNGTWLLTVRDGNNTGANGTIEFAELIFDQTATTLSFPQVIESDCIFGTPIPIEISGCVSVPTTLVQVKAFLEGAYNGSGEMRTTINHLLPQEQPYSASPWFFETSATLNDIPENVVDWVLVEARHENDMYITTEQQAAFLLDNGDIVDKNGITIDGIYFYDLEEGENYYVIVRHRNHIDVMSSEVITVDNGVLEYDFTDAMAKAKGNAQMLNVDPNIFAMQAGDFDANGIINYQDFNLFTEENGWAGVYYRSDANMNGTVNFEDFNFYLINISKISITEVR